MSDEIPKRKYTKFNRPEKSTEKYVLNEEQKARRKETNKLYYQNLKKFKEDKLKEFQKEIDAENKEFNSNSLKQSNQPQIYSPTIAPIPVKQYIPVAEPIFIPEFDVSIFKQDIQDQLKFLKMNYSSVYYNQIINALQNNKSNYN